MKVFYKRIDLTELEYENLLKCINYDKLKEVEKQYDNIETFEGFKLTEKLNNPKNIAYSASKSTAASKATKVRTEKVKYKIDLAIEILQTEKKTITHYTIAKKSGVSFNTVKKHISNDNLISLNEVKQ